MRTDSPTIDQPGPPPPPPQIPDLELIRTIGEGSFGQVWLAQNRATGQIRAVKVIARPAQGASPRADRELQSLVQMATTLSGQHEHLLSIHHVGRTPDCLFYIMDPADDLSGQRASLDPSYQPATLAGRLGAGELPPEQCWDYARQLLAGLAFIHSAGMVHRDVKPANCVIIGGVLKLADYGLLAVADRTLSRVGTPKYMPPDGRMDARADVFAAGLVIYEMVTGLPAEEFPSLGPRARQISGDRRLAQLNRCVLRACDPDPARRYPDAGQMLAALDRPLPPRRGASRRRVLIAGLLTAIGAGGGMWAWWWTHPPTVAVNFITHPFEAMILLDDEPAVQSDGTYYRTPCTIPNLPAGPHRVTFRREGAEDRSVGWIDFREVREIEVGW